MFDQMEMLHINHHSVKLVKEKEVAYSTKYIKSPDDAFESIKETTGIHEKPNEHFGFLSLSTKNEVIGVHVVFAGSLNASIVHPRDVYQRAILNNAAAIIVFHNHPSTNPKPSNEDITVTKRLIEAGKMIGVQLLDHIIVGDETRFISLKDKGYL